MGSRSNSRSTVATYSDSYTDYHAYTYTHANANTNTDTDADSHSGTDYHAYTYTHANANANTDADTDADSHTDTSSGLFVSDQSIICHRTARWWSSHLYCQHHDNRRLRLVG
jgi:hypothetical protein